MRKFILFLRLKKYINKYGGKFRATLFANKLINR